MRDHMAMTANVKRFLAAVRELNDRPLGVEGMAILWGDPGEGKSTTVAYACNKLDGLFLRAHSCWTVTSMLKAMMVELGMEPLHRRHPMVQAITLKLGEHPRPIFIDESDYLFRQPDMLDSMRDIYDDTGSPVVLIGMQRFAQKIQNRERFARRITQWVEFCGISINDTRILAESVCEVTVEEDLLQHMHQAARSNIGRMVTALSRIETFARINKVDSVSLKDWGGRALFFDQPNFKPKRPRR